MRWALAAGLLVALIVIASPVSALDHQLLTFHMVQHLVLMTIAAPLILAGIPATAKLQHSRAARLLLHPVSCWLAGTGGVPAGHVPAAPQLTMSAPSLHLLQQVSFPAGGLLFLHPGVGRGPIEALVPRGRQWTLHAAGRLRRKTAPRGELLSPTASRHGLR